MLGLSPFVRTLTALAAGSGLAVPLVVMTLVAAGLVAVGLAGLTRRDLDQG